MIRILESQRRGAAADAPRRPARRSRRDGAADSRSRAQARRQGAARVRAQVRRPRRARACACRSANSSAPRGRSRPSSARAVETAADEHPRVREAAAAAARDRRRSRRACSSARSCGRSTPWPPTFPPAAIPLPSTLHDDRDPGAGGRRAEHLRRLAARRSPEILGTASLLGVDRRLPDGRRAGHRRLRLRHPHGAARRPHRRARQHLRGRGQEAARRRSGHRLRRRPHRDPDHRRRRRPALPRRRHAGPGRARCGRLRHPADHLEVARQRRGRAKSSASLPTLPTAPVARKAIDTQQRHHPGAHRSTRPSSSPTASRPST